MKKFNLLFMLFAIIICTSSTFAQETFKQKLERKLKEAKEQKIDKTIDKALGKSEEKLDKGVNGVLEGKDKSKKDRSLNSEGNLDNNAVNDKENVTNTQNKQSVRISATSKFDFIPGEKVLYYDDFSTTSIGDFPHGWNTNSSAEIVKLTGSEDKWLFMTKDGYFQPIMVTDMPENFTLEFNLFNRYRSNNILNYHFILAASDNPKKDLSEGDMTNMFRFNWAGCIGEAGFYTNENGEKTNENASLNIKGLMGGGDNFETPVNAKISIWRQKTRLRIYVNDAKVLDLPQALDPKLRYNVFKFGSNYMNYSDNEKKDEFMVSNLRYSIGAPDTRSRLITEGKLVTRGILFDVNSDQIKPESNGVLKEIAAVLQENPTVKVKIIGHTDSDGDAALNLDLSKRRATAVKAALTDIFGISGDRFMTDGKGAAEPTDPNTTIQGKANNRRVEFIKL
ncbi:OmpA family protein [Pedobacter sp. SD-b]|uniref:OmpA family protein n=1 Tax=Pedobacter segetis TaxID=2793069 RepID=A0ABS1BI71_9SPHI|nr:OmpA family protein [Pedobacter segetis]MBK0382579.1 OmpA family protein [Pedobacter segetis]